jgi:hypothetical protein
LAASKDLMRVRHVKKISLLLFASIAAVSCPAQSANVTFSATVANLCVLTLTSAGTLAPSANGTILSSEESGGVNATLGVVATGTNPTLNFTAPALTGPSGSTAGATKEIGYTAAGGGTQGYTTGATTLTVSRLLDVLTVKGRVTNSNGFVAGSYGLSSTVTCQQ